MFYYSTIMHQLLTLIPRHQFEKQVSALDTDKHVKTFTIWCHLRIKSGHPKMHIFVYHLNDVFII